MQIARAAGFGGFILALLLLVGCDGARDAEVRGEVKFDGEIVDDGAVQFYPADGKNPTAGTSIKGGRYFAKVPIGNVKVSISWPKAYDKKKLYEDDPNSPIIDMKKESLPDKYSHHENTELQFEVKPGVNVKNWDLNK